MSAERIRYGLLGLVTLFSALVAWAVFNPMPHAGGDNAGYIALAHGLLTQGTYSDVFDPQGLPHTKYPPVYPLLLALFMALGARTWSALKGTAAAPVVAASALTYLWAERRLGPLGGASVALLFAVSSGVVYYSQWILSDPLFVALTIGALWALEGADGASADASEGGGSGEEGARREGEAKGDSRHSFRMWLVLGVVFTALAFFTRSAGLPLVLALLGWLALRRRWWALVGSGAALGLPMLLWALRGRGEGVAQYGTEFWMVNPYDPALGTIGPLGLLPRMVSNARAYLFQHGPAGIVGADAPALVPLGLVLAGAALAGWILSVRRRVQVAELFFPLYTGLILVWPEVWGGDRFALPLLPLVFLYSGVALQAVSMRLPEAAGRAMAALALLAVLLPAGAHWLDQGRQIRACAAVVETRGPWACYGPRIGYFVAAATWTGAGLPEGASVLSRKPRHFYLLSGHPSRAFPFTDDPEALLGLADELGARYVLLDQWDGLAARYVGGAVRRRPEAFCWVQGFGMPEEGGAQLLGILDPVERGGGADPDAGIGSCPSSFYRDGVTDPAVDYSSSDRIPLLADLDS